MTSAKALLFPALLSVSAALALLSSPLPADAQAAPVPKTAAPPLTARTAALPRSKNVHSGTLASADDSTVTVTLPDSSALAADVKPSSVFLLNGISATPADFKPGMKVMLRTRAHASNDTNSVVLLCDLPSAQAIEAWRKKPLVGTLQSMGEKDLVVKPDGSAVPVTLRLSPKTVYRKGGKDASAATFGVGAAVTVVTRGLPSGLLLATIVSDSNADAIAEKTALKPLTLSGRVTAVQAEQGLVTVAPKAKPSQTIAVTDATHVRVGKADASLKEVAVGMELRARLSRTPDAAGHLTATSVSASVAAPSRKKAATPMQKTPAVTAKP